VAGIGVGGIGVETGGTGLGVNEGYMVGETVGVAVNGIEVESDIAPRILLLRFQNRDRFNQ
jgi:hypothetical protein